MEPWFAGNIGEKRRLEQGRALERGASTDSRNAKDLPRVLL